MRLGLLPVACSTLLAQRRTLHASFECLAVHTGRSRDSGTPLLPPTLPPSLCAWFSMSTARPHAPRQCVQGTESAWPQDQPSLAFVAARTHLAGVNVKSINDDEHERSAPSLALGLSTIHRRLNCTHTGPNQRTTHAAHASAAAPPGIATSCAKRLLASSLQSSSSATTQAGFQRVLHLSGLPQLICALGIVALPHGLLQHTLATRRAHCKQGRESGNGGFHLPFGACLHRTGSSALRHLVVDFVQHLLVMARQHTPGPCVGACASLHRLPVQAMGSA